MTMHVDKWIVAKCYRTQISFASCLEKVCIARDTSTHQFFSVLNLKKQWVCMIVSIITTLASILLDIFNQIMESCVFVSSSRKNKTKQNLSKRLQWGNDGRILNLNIRQITNAIFTVQSNLVFTSQSLLLQNFLQWHQK